MGALFSKLALFSLSLRHISFCPTWPLELTVEIVVSVVRQHADLVLPSDVGAISPLPLGHISVNSSVEADEPTPYFTTPVWRRYETLSQRFKGFCETFKPVL